MQADLWSLGCIMFALLTGTPPFECSTVQDTLVRIKSGKFNLPSAFSASSGDLINQLLTQDPKVRPTVYSVLNHIFITSNCANKRSSSLERDQDEEGRMLLSDLVST